MGTLANNENPDILHCLLRFKPHSETAIHNNLNILSVTPKSTQWAVSYFLYQ